VKHALHKHLGVIPIFPRCGPHLSVDVCGESLQLLAQVRSLRPNTILDVRSDDLVTVRTYDAEVRGLQLKVDVGLSDYRHYYNSTLKRCLLLVNKDTTMVGDLSHTSYLIDTDRRMYAVYMETNGQIQSCTLIQSARQTTACKSRDEFVAFVSQYLKKQK
jgi:hypothetical protein